MLDRLHVQKHKKYGYHFASVFLTQVNLSLITELDGLLFHK